MAAISPDGTWTAFIDVGKGLRRIDVSGGPITRIADARNAFLPVVSPDGQQIAYGYDDAAEHRRWAVVPAQGGKAILDVPGSGGRVAWMSASDAFTYQRINEGATNIWKQPLDGSPASRLTPFKSGRISSHTWLPDGKLVFSRRDDITDVVLISDFH